MKTGKAFRNAIVYVMIAVMMTSGAAAFTAEPVRGLEPGLITDMETTWEKREAGWVGVTVFNINGEAYEMCVAGLGEQLPEELIGTLIAGWLKGEAVTLTGDLIDAEKASHLIPNRTGSDETWVVQDTVRGQTMWGDGLMCWAASASNMLWMTGWAQKAVNPDSEAPFTGEDDVFSYFVRHAMNDGAYQSDGIEWFFTGETLEFSVREEGKALLPAGGYRTEEASFSTRRGEDADFIGHCEQILCQLKTGGAVGLTVDFCSREYPLKADPMTTVTLTDGKYVSTRFEMPEEDDPHLEKRYFTFGNTGEIILLEKDGEQFTDAAGTVWPALSVKYDLLYRDDDRYWLVDVNDTAGFMEVSIFEEHAPEEIDFSKGFCPIICGNGAHALTAPGYIMKLTGEDAGVKALFIADSDNDAIIYVITEENAKREERPDRYILYPVETVSADGLGETYDLRGYTPDGSTPVTLMAGLNAAENGQAEKEP